MSKMQLVRALVAERLAAAAEDIMSVVERTITEKKMVHTSEMSPEQQRTVVHERLSVVADEIFRILQIMMGEYETEVSCSQEDIDRQRTLLDITLKTETHFPTIDRLPLSGSDCPSGLQKSQKTSDLPQIKDASTETDSKLIHPHQTQRAEQGTSTMTEAEAQGEHPGLPLSHKQVLLSKHSEAGSEEDDSDNSNKQNQNLSEDFCKMCGRAFHEGKIKKHVRKIASANMSQTTGQSCCRVCGKCFRYRRSFLKHVLKHEHDLCGVCGKHLDSDESLKLHLQTHNEENSCRDDRCSDVDSKVDESDEDWKETDGTDSDDGESNKNEKEQLCFEKPESKTKSQASNKPKRSKNKECKDLSPVKYCCKVCDKPFCYRASFLRHVQEDESETDLCGVCGKHFESNESLRLHLQTYIRTNDCEVCGKHFDGHKQLEMHMRTHTGEKPYICSVCGKAFAQNGNLMGHMRVHTGEKPYVCNVCGQSFSFKEYMMAHMRIHTGEKPFLCSVCGKGFRQRGTLKTHMMIHTGESSHRCSICDKKFYKSGALKIHMRSHTGEKPYLCNVCGKSFTASGSLTKHMGAHEGERTHCCTVCGKGFLRKEDLKRHFQTHREESTQLTCL